MKFLKDLYYDKLENAIEDKKLLKAAGFIKGKKIIIPKGTEILKINKYGGANEYIMKNNGIKIAMDLFIEDENIIK